MEPRPCRGDRRQPWMRRRVEPIPEPDDAELAYWGPIWARQAWSVTAYWAIWVLATLLSLLAVAFWWVHWRPPSFLDDMFVGLIVWSPTYFLLVWTVAWQVRMRIFREDRLDLLYSARLHERIGKHERQWLLSRLAINSVTQRNTELANSQPWVPRANEPEEDEPRQPARLGAMWYYWNQHDNGGPPGANPWRRN